MENLIKCYCGHTTTCDCGPEEPKQEDMITKIMQMDAKMAYDSLPKQGKKIKQETLEEAAEKYLQEWRLVNNIHLSNVIHAERCKNDFIAGANYQAERMYSEQDMAEAFIACWKANVSDRIECKVSFKEWFEQFKKK